MSGIPLDESVLEEPEGEAPEPHNIDIEAGLETRIEQQHKPKRGKKTGTAAAVEAMDVLRIDQMLEETRKALAQLFVGRQELRVERQKLREEIAALNRTVEGVQKAFAVEESKRTAHAKAEAQRDASRVKAFSEALDVVRDDIRRNNNLLAMTKGANAIFPAIARSGVLVAVGVVVLGVLRAVNLWPW